MLELPQNHPPIPGPWNNCLTGSWCQMGWGPLSSPSSNLRANDTPPLAPRPHPLQGRNWTLAAADVWR